MKKIFLLLVAIMALVSCGKNSKTETQIRHSTTQKTGVELIYFHGKQRCITCNAIEKLTKEVVEKTFAQQLKDSTISLKIIDISTPTGEVIADDYEVTWSSLYINKWEKGKETRHNMTDFSFSCAKNSPNKFKAGITKKIEELLK